MRPIAKVVVWLLCAMLALTGLPIPNHAYLCQGDGSYLGSWTDSTPLTTGNYLSLRTTTNNVLFDEVMVGKVKKYYYQGGVRTAMRDGTSVYYLFGDHLGSTNVTTDNGSALVARLLYKPFGREGEGAKPAAEITGHGCSGQKQPAPGFQRRLF